MKDIKKLDVVAKKRLKQRLEKFATNPKKYSVKLVNSRIGDYRFRVGNYRIIFDMRVDEIIILRIAHRKEIYRDV